MDAPLYALALVVFGVLYIGIGVVLIITLIVTMIVIFLYLALRYGNVVENYPHGLNDTVFTMILVGVTWGLFVFVGPKNPVPFLPSNGSVTFGGSILPLNSIVTIGLIFAIAFLIVASFWIKARQDSGQGPSGPSDPTKSPLGVGAR